MVTSPAKHVKTDVGTLPADWGLVPLREVMRFKNGVNAEKSSYGRGIRFANVLEVITHTHLMALDIPGRISITKHEEESYSVIPGDVLFNRTSEVQNEVGLASVYVDSVPAVFGGFVIRGRPISEELHAAYSGYGLRAPAIRKQIVAKGQGAIRANIGQVSLGSILAPLPPLPEQRAIAEALGDVDALIDSLDRLIAKKRDLKQGAMQQLLTGKTRLPGFTKKKGFRDTDAGNVPLDWDTMPLLTAVHIANGQVDPKTEPYRSMTLVAPDHIERATGRLLSRESAHSQKAISGKYLFAAGDIIYSKIRPYLRKAVLADFDGLCSADMYPMRPSVGVSGGFMLATLLGHRFSIFAESVSVRSGMPKINRTELAEFSVAVPPQAEQIAIAAAFSDVDSEIAALEQRRDKIRLLKQGMMQELLTGKTRLV